MLARLHKLALACLIAWPAAASSMALLFSGTPIIDYDMTGTLVVESEGAREQVLARLETHPQQVSPYPHLLFGSSLGLIRLRLDSLGLDIRLAPADGRSFIPFWKAATVEHPGSGISLPLQCQSLYVDGKWSWNKKNPKEHLAEGVPFPEPGSSAAQAFPMNCMVHNLGRLFESGLPFGAELTRKPLAVRLAGPGSSLCLNVPGQLDGRDARLRICATGHAAQARLSYH